MCYQVFEVAAVRLGTVAVELGDHQPDYIIT
jgi:hypothetical protein